MEAIPKIRALLANFQFWAYYHAVGSPWLFGVCSTVIPTIFNEFSAQKSIFYYHKINICQLYVLKSTKPKRILALIFHYYIVSATFYYTCCKHMYFIYFFSYTTTNCCTQCIFHANLFSTQWFTFLSTVLSLYKITVMRLFIIE